MPLFEVAILEKPTKNEADSGGSEQLVFGPKAVVAKDAQSAAVCALVGEVIRKFPADRIEVLIRPFK